MLAARLLGRLPSAKRIYTISEVTTHPSTGEIGLRLREFPRIVFHHCWFRPLTQKSAEADIAMFKPIAAEAVERA